MPTPPTSTPWVPMASLAAPGTGPLAYKGDWAAGAYYDGDVVVRNGVAFLCLGAPGGGPTTDVPDTLPWGLGVPGVALDSVVGTEAVSSAAEITIYSFVVPANLLGLSKSIEFTLWGDYLKNQGVGDTVTFRFKYGATTLVTSAAWSPGGGSVTSVNRYPWRFDVVLGNRGSAAAQWLSAVFRYSSRTSGADAGNILLGASQDGTANGYGVATEDSTLAKTFSFTAQWSAASANNSFRPAHCGAVLL